MKKGLIVGLCIGAISVSLVGCTSSNTESGMKDGVYQVETKNADEHGGKAKASITVADGKIAEASFIEFNDNGDKRTNEAYNKNMKDTAGTSPEEYEPQLEQQVVDKQSAEIDGVSGATSSSDKAKALFVAAIENANEGNTEKELVE